MHLIVFGILVLGLMRTSWAAPERPLLSVEFGVANAPGQVEDSLSDIWLDWGYQGKIAGFTKTPRAQDRLEFWSKPEIELDLARETGFQIFRFGVDWGRIMPAPHVFDESVIRTYHSLIKKIRQRSLKPYLTLMHHSLPDWLQDQGGWMQDSARGHFLEFARRMFKEFHSDVSVWMTFNEANVFVALAHTAGIWPPGEHRPLTSFFHFGPLRGEAVIALDRMADAHNAFYSWAQQHYPGSKIGVAHNLAWYTGKGILDRFAARWVSNVMNWRFLERIRNHMDFVGFNYYGAEWLKSGRIDLDPEEEYSEAGRAVFPEGLLLLMREAYQRFHLPMIITENGMADRTDILRPAYLIEHLKAVEQAKKEGIPVEAFILWTLTDNLEWADGYCPKFGLFEVDRSTMKRTARPSQALIKTIIQSREIPNDLRDQAWRTVETHRGKPRPFCRNTDGVQGLATPTQRPVSEKDWRLPRRKAFFSD